MLRLVYDVAQLLPRCTVAQLGAQGAAARQFPQIARHGRAHAPDRRAEGPHRHAADQALRTCAPALGSRPGRGRVPTRGPGGVEFTPGPDTGAGATLGSFLSSGTGIGPAITYTLPVGGKDLTLVGKWLHDLGSSHRLQGDMVYGSFVIAF